MDLKSTTSRTNFNNTALVVCLFLFLKFIISHLNLAYLQNKRAAHTTSRDHETFTIEQMDN